MLVTMPALSVRQLVHRRDAEFAENAQGLEQSMMLNGVLRLLRAASAHSASLR
jgi:hypothetical protein